jgi:hypothetical protein
MYSNNLISEIYENLRYLLKDTIPVVKIIAQSSSHHNENLLYQFLLAIISFFYIS